MNIFTFRSNLSIGKRDRVHLKSLGHTKFHQIATSTYTAIDRGQLVSPCLRPVRFIYDRARATIVVYKTVGPY